MNEPNRKRFLEAANHMLGPGDLAYANAPKERKRAGRVEIDRTEYLVLRRVAAWAVTMYPAIEQTSIPVTRSMEFEHLRVAIRQYLTIRSVSAGDAETIVGLTDLMKDLA